MGLGTTGRGRVNHFFNHVGRPGPEPGCFHQLPVTYNFQNQAAEWASALSVPLYYQGIISGTS